MEPGLLLASEIGQGPGQPEHPVEPAGAQADRCPVCWRRGNIAFGGGRYSVWSARVGTSALHRHGVSANRLAARSRAASTRSATTRLGSMNRRSASSSRLVDRSRLTLHVDAVEQRAGEPAQVAAPGRRRAPAGSTGARRLPARARVGRQHQLEPGRERDRAPAPWRPSPRPTPAAGAASRARPSRTPAPRPGTGRPGGPGRRRRGGSSAPPPPTIGRDRRGVVRRQERRPGQQRAARGQHPATEWIGGHLQCGSRSRGGSRVGSRSASIVLPAPGGPEHPAGCGRRPRADLQRLAGHRPGRPRRPGRGAPGRQVVGEPSADRREPHRARRSADLRGVPAGSPAPASCAGEPVGRSAASSRAAPAWRPGPRSRPARDRPRRRWRAGTTTRAGTGLRPPPARRGARRAPVGRGRRDPARRGRTARRRLAGHDPGRRRAAPPRWPGRSMLPRLGRLAGNRLTVIRASGQVVAAVDHGRADPVAGLAQRGVGQADEVEAGHAVAHVGLDLDEVAGHADQRDTARAGDGHSGHPRVDDRTVREHLGGTSSSPAHGGRRGLRRTAPAR